MNTKPLCTQNSLSTKIPYQQEIAIEATPYRYKTLIHTKQLSTHTTSQTQLSQWQRHLSNQPQPN